MFKDELQILLGDADDGTPEAKIARMLSERGAVSASEISRSTGLARSTVSMALTEMRRAGVVVENLGSAGVRGVGRPATAFALNPEAGTCVGMHLTRGSISVMLADVSHSVISEQIVALEEDYSPDQAAPAVRRAIRGMYAKAGLSMNTLLGVGVAASGPIAPDGKVLRASIVPTWAGVNLREVFEPALERPIFADNESNCAAIAEMTWGAAIGWQDFVLFKIDIGVGGAVVSGGRVITGVAGAGGEFGHMSLDPRGDLCRCGNRGCLELTASLNPAMAAASKLFGHDISAEDLIARATAGHVGCARLVADTAEIAGRGLGIIGVVINPGLIVIGGIAAMAGPLLLEPLIRSYEKHTMVKSNDVPESQRTRIEIGRFTRNDALMGAVALVLRRHGRLT